MPGIFRPWDTIYAGANANPVDGVKVVQVANGDFWMIWQEQNDVGVASPFGSDIVGQRFNPLGVPQGGLVRLNNGFSGNNEGAPEVAREIGGPGFLMVYQVQFGTGQGSFINIYVEKKEADGSPDLSYQAPLLIAADPTNNDDPINISDPQIASASATNGLVTYKLHNGSSSGTYGQLFNPTTMQLIGNAFLIGESTAGFAANVPIAVLPNGGYKIGDFVISQNGVQSTPYPQHAVVLTGGGYVVALVFEDEKPFGALIDFRIEASVYSQAGVLINTIVIDPESDVAEFDRLAINPIVVATPDGGFLLQYDSVALYQTAGSSTPTLSYTADGTLGGVSELPFAGEPLVFLADGRMLQGRGSQDGEARAVIWDTRTGPGSRIYNPTLQIGTPGNDVFTTDPNGASYITGHDGNDTITEGLGVDGLIFGGEGNDTIILRAADGLEATADGGPGQNILQIDDFVAPATINFTTDTVTSNGQTSTFTNFEEFRSSSSASLTIIGAPLRVTTGAGSDFIDFSASGFLALTGGGNDGIYFGARMTASSQVDAGAGTSDQIGLQGNYPGLTFHANATLGVELIVLLNGADNRFGGATGTNLSYNLTTVDANIAAGQILTFQANTLRAGESFTLNGAAETNGTFLTFGGLGTENLTGGQAADGFYFGTGRLGVSDRLDGQGGSDQLGLQGDFAGVNALTLGAAQLTSIEFIVLMSAGDTRFGGALAGQNFSYNLTMHNGNVAAGQQMVISATTLRAAEILTFNGGAEQDGGFRVFSGAGADTIIGGAQADEIWGGAGTDRIEGRAGADVLRGGAGSDRFSYRAVSESTAAARDRIMDFASGDLIDLLNVDGNTLLAGFQNFYLINSAAAFDGAGQLRITQTGTSALIQGDSNGDGIADFAIEVTVTDGHTLTRTGDFVGLNAPPGGGIGMAPFADDDLFEPQLSAMHRNNAWDLHLASTADLTL